MAVNYKNLVGIEFDGKYVKLVKTGKDGKITNYSFSEIPEGVLVAGKIESKQMLTESIKDARKKLGTSFNRCSLCITCPDVVIRHITIPVMDEANIPASISLELSGFLPVATERYSIDYIVREEVVVDNVKRYSLTVFAVPKDIVETYAACVKNAGLNLLYIDVMENAVEKLGRFLLDKSVTALKNYAYLYVDNQKASISIYSDTKLNMNKNIGNGAENIFKEISERTANPPEIARQILFSNNILGEGVSFEEERKVLEKYLSEVALETTRLIDYFKNRNKTEEIEVIYLAGSFSNLAGIIGCLEERIGTKVRLVSGFLDRFYAATPGRNNLADFTNAYAITLREEKK